MRRRFSIAPISRFREVSESSRSAVPNTSTVRDIVDLDPPAFGGGRLSVSVPRVLYSMPVQIDDEEKVRAMAGSLGAAGGDDSSTALVKLALLLGGSRRDDWIVHDGRLHSFTAIDETEDFRRVRSGKVVAHYLDGRTTDIGATIVESVIARLLHRTLQGALEQRAVSWHASREVFRFMPAGDGQRSRREYWEHRGSRTQTVYLGKGQHGSELRVALHTHLAFSATFGRTDDGWHCDVSPGWLYTEDLFQENDEAASPEELQRRADAAVGIDEALGFIAWFLADDPSPPDTSVKFGDLEPGQALPSTPIGDA